jgi:hypothetical protein
VKKLYPVILQVLAVLCVSACDKKVEEFDGTEPIKMEKFDKTESIKITYTVSEKQKLLTLSDANTVKKMVELFQIKSTEKGVAFGMVELGTVTFTLPGGAVVDLLFVSEKTLQGDEGRIDLKDKKFYDKINKILSEKEGRKIDILIDN